jgi:hypothetical protein
MYLIFIYCIIIIIIIIIKLIKMYQLSHRICSNFVLKKRENT